MIRSPGNMTYEGRVNESSSKIKKQGLGGYDNYMQLHKSRGSVQERLWELYYFVSYRKVRQTSGMIQEE